MYYTGNRKTLRQYLFSFFPCKVWGGVCFEIYEFQRSLAKDDREDRSEFSSIRSKKLLIDRETYVGKVRVCSYKMLSFNIFFT